MSEAQNGGNVMERLTDKAWRNFDPWECCGQDKYCQRGCHDPGGCTKGCIVPQLYARLGAYEDTGLTPGEVKSMQEKHFSGLEMAKLHSALMELKKYQEADRAGQLLVLPCKVGDTVYFALLGSIIEKQVFSIVSFSNSTRIYCGGTSEYFRPEDIGKTFFLTREAADRALEVKKDEQSRTYQHPPEVV